MNYREKQNMAKVVDNYICNYVLTLKMSLFPVGNSVNKSAVQYEYFSKSTVIRSPRYNELRYPTKNNS